LNNWTDASVGASNACTKTTVAGEFNSGAAAMKMTVATTGGSNLAGRYQDVTVRAGERVNFTCAIRGDSTRTARVKIQNRQTQSYLTSGGAWQAGATDYATRSTNTYSTSGPTSFTVESPTTYRPDLQTFTLRITCYVDGSSAGSGYVDDVYLWPSADTLACIGHNFDPGVSFEVRRDTAAFAGAGTVEATLAGTALELTFWTAFGAMRDERYWKTTISGTPSAKPWMGELIIFQRLSLAKIFEPPDDRGFTWPASRMGDRSLLMTDLPQRDWNVSFNHEASQYVEARDSVLLRSANGHYPLVVIPSSSENAVIYGRLEPTWRSKRVLVDGSVEFYQSLEWKLTELRLPSFIR